MRWLLILPVLGLGSEASPARAADGARTSVEVRVTPPAARPLGAPSLCPMLAVPVAEHWLVGGGYELLQDYDATILNEDMGASPVWMSGIRLGAWYRGGVTRDGLSFGVGAMATFSHPRVSVIKVSGGLDNRTYIFDLGLDLSLGHTWENFRLEAFFLPAWSVGRFSTDRQSDRWNGFTPRFGTALAWVF
jgi:hypothetical protein